MQTPNEQQLESLLSDLFELAELIASQRSEEKKKEGESDFRYSTDGGRKVLFCDIYDVLGAFMRADGNFSYERAKIATFLGKSLETGTKLKMDGISQSTITSVQQDVGSYYKRSGVSLMMAVNLLIRCDKILRTNYADQGKNVYRRLVTLFLNAGGPPSPESQQLFEEYEKVLTTSDVAEKQRRQRAMSPESTLALEALLKTLNSLIGLRQVKQDVVELANFIRVQQMRQAKGLKASEISLHLVFHGNPGTGKTTVARLLAEIYKTLGVVSKGHLVETDRSDLVAGYVGQTALKVKAVAEKALGGILFIDEAYALKRSGDTQDYGNEAIETLLKFMEDNRQDLVVIVAGYPIEMKRFIEANPGLQSRFNKSLSFADYTPEELMAIFLRLCNESDYKLSEAAGATLATYFDVAYKNRDLKFGNARLVRNIFEKAITNVANRVVQDPQADGSMLELIEESDVASATFLEPTSNLPESNN
jgi:stage V sporulation protein K